MPTTQPKYLESTEDLVHEICEALKSHTLKKYFFDHYRYTPHLKQERTFQHAVLRELYRRGCKDVFSEVRYTTGTGSEKNPPAADLALVKRLPANDPKSKTLTHSSADGDKERIISQVEIKYHYLSDLKSRYSSVKSELSSDLDRQPDIFIHVIADRLGIAADDRFQDILSIPYAKDDSAAEKNRQKAFENLRQIYCGEEKNKAGKNIPWNGVFKHVYAQGICIVEKSKYVSPSVPPLTLLCSVFVKTNSEHGDLGEKFKSTYEWASAICKKEKLNLDTH